MNVLPARNTYYDLKNALPEFEFKAYGGGSPNGTIHTIQEIASIMEQSRFGYHVKPGGDGFGHVIHSWSLIGRPVITNLTDYENQLAGQLLRSGITCINLEGRSLNENIALVKNISIDQYESMCLAMRSRAEECINYEREAVAINRFFMDLV